MRIPFSKADVILGPLERDDAMAFFKSHSGQALLNALEALTPQPEANGDSEIVAQGAKLIEGYQLVFQNLELLFTPEGEAPKAPRPAYPDPEDDKMWADEIDPSISGKDRETTK